MGKQEIKQKETQVSTNGGIGKQLEQTFTVDDNCLPSPGELQAYKNIDPRIVDYLIDASVKEQTHRHAMDKQKLQIIKKTEGRIGRRIGGECSLLFFVYLSFRQLQVTLCIWISLGLPV